MTFNILKLAGLFPALMLLSSCTSQSSSPENGAISAIMQRKSVRAYLDREVEESKIDVLMRAAMAAPTGMGLKPWEFVVVKDKQVLDEMGDGLPRARMLKDTRQAIIVCGDTIKSSYWYLDCSAAAENILIAAESMGLGAVWTAAYPYRDRIEVVKKALDLPDHILPLCVIPLGYPASPEKPKDKYDLTKIHRNKY